MVELVKSRRGSRYGPLQSLVRSEPHRRQEVGLGVSLVVSRGRVPAQGDGSTLEQMAAIARLSPNFFAWQFKRSTGLPPHLYVIAHRVERAKQLLQGGGDFSLAQVAARQLLEPEPLLPSLQAPCRRHAGAVPDARKNRQKGSKGQQDSKARSLYHSS
jgi:AraC-like DNA-binding protein